MEEGPTQGRGRGPPRRAAPRLPPAPPRPPGRRRGRRQGGQGGRHRRKGGKGNGGLDGPESRLRCPPGPAAGPAAQRARLPAAPWPRPLRLLRGPRTPLLPLGAPAPPPPSPEGQNRGLHPHPHLALCTGSERRRKVPPKKVVYSLNFQKLHTAYAYSDMSPLCKESDYLGDFLPSSP